MNGQVIAWWAERTTMRTTILSSPVTHSQCAATPSSTPCATRSGNSTSLTTCTPTAAPRHGHRLDPAQAEHFTALREQLITQTRYTDD
jgi:hypothetical protein